MNQQEKYNLMAMNPFPQTEVFVWLNEYHAQLDMNRRFHAAFVAHD
ncbi:MAG: hypothetical protein V7K23_00505 [Nostoc sp.]